MFSLAREFWLAWRSRRLLYYIINLVVNALWVIVLLLAIAWYGGEAAVAARFIFWGFVVLAIFSQLTWGAAGFNNYIKSGVADYLIASPADFHKYLITTSLVSAALALPAVAAQIALYYILFGDLPPLAQPLYFIIALFIFITSATCITTAATLFFTRLRNPGLAANILQWTIPLSGGMIPPTAMPPEVAHWLLYSPLHYVIAPLIYSATGSWLGDPVKTLGLGVVITACLYAFSLYIARGALRRVRATGKWGSE
ncbi:ABC-2 type transport system, membrane protein [Pyrobaculum aerophilum str. IM2]|uniref:ABC-2 type transport system, membrane protein n=2 Tax=Pyrobaculum aerophilum TaxID=13773 RepID=Q8ZTW3_PYRAE|nr:ABC transporter permease [Pyrobaculum aerophilum]AAL64646.1 ABC-2 type transport system, membrane protein [Pyrobaculum aerophilum str. IM2]HII46164.1 ABC transporter permease [Pyrobaculum aerophilum]